MRNKSAVREREIKLTVGTLKTLAQSCVAFSAIGLTLFLNACSPISPSVPKFTGQTQNNKEPLLREVL